MWEIRFGIRVSIFALLSTLSFAQFRTVTVQNANNNPVPTTIQNAPSVTVNNTGGNPVPVTGSVNAAVTGSVAITGTPAVTISGNPSVNFNGPQPVKSLNAPATVINSQSIVPVVVRNMDESGRIPFQTDLGCNTAGNSQCGQSFVVPTGQEVVIEFINTRANIVSGTPQPERYNLVTIAGNQTEIYQFSPGQPLATTGEFAGNQMVHISADPGTTISFTGLATAAGGNAALSMVISGYTVSLP